MQHAAERFLVAALVEDGLATRGQPADNRPSGDLALGGVDSHLGEVVRFYLTNAANAIVHGENPLFSDKINAPYGLNLMANTSVLAQANASPQNVLALPGLSMQEITAAAMAPAGFR